MPDLPNDYGMFRHFLKGAKRFLGLVLLVLKIIKAIHDLFK
jgi:hypothetical protein